MRIKRGFCQVIFAGIIIVITVKLSPRIQLKEQTVNCAQLEKHVITRRSWSTPPMRTDLPKVGEFLANYWRNDTKAPRRITLDEHLIMMEMLRLVDEVLRKWKISYFMTAGTLIGSWQYHDIIPWDDDIDIIADFWQRKEMIEALSSIGGVYKVYATQSNFYKLFRTDGSESQYPWTWPFVDIFLFIADVDAVWEYSYPDRRIPHQIIFPLTLRPFGSLWLPAPANVSSYLIYGGYPHPLQCITNIWDHRKEKAALQQRVNCTELRLSYPFVAERRSAQPPWMSIEKLMIGEDVLQQVPIPLPEI